LARFNIFRERKNYKIICSYLGKDTQVLELPVIGSLADHPPWFPLAVPRDLAPRLARLHGHPFVWWMGQLIAYVMRPQDSLAALLEETAQVLGFQNPVVGYKKYKRKTFNSFTGAILECTLDGRTKSGQKLHFIH
jgi:Alpha-(1,6)-fucosyltransferase N- and catalytic domains